eukprot:7794912-Alexandrium_andersonii.AAC.1
MGHSRLLLFPAPSASVVLFEIRPTLRVRQPRFVNGCSARVNARLWRPSRCAFAQDAPLSIAPRWSVLSGKFCPA